MKKTKEINLLGKTNYKHLFDNAISCGEMSEEEGCGSYDWYVQQRDGTKFKLKCNNCSREVEVEIPSHNKYIKNASEEKKTF